MKKHCLLWCLLFIVLSMSMYGQALQPQKLSATEIVCVSPFVNGFAWAKSQSIFKKEQRALRLKSIGIMDERVKHKIQSNKGLLISEDSLVYMAIPFDSCYHRQVVDYVIANGRVPLSPTQAKRCLLYLTQTQKVHLFNSIIPEREWDF